MENLESWLIDPERSRLLFTLRHIVVQQIRGSFGRWGGALLLDRVQPARSQLRVWVDLATIETGAAERDGHVKSAEFLDVLAYPRAEFRSTDVMLRPDGAVVVAGWLDLHGHGKKIELDVEVGDSWTDAGGHRRAKYVARGKVDRQAFGLHWNQDLDVGGVVVGDIVDFTAELELLQVAERASAFERAERAPAP